MSYTLEPAIHGFTGKFAAMASPCEVLIESKDPEIADWISRLAFTETQRIEQKYSRYLQGNLCARINQSSGLPFDIDAETFALLKFASEIYRLSDGMFDLTSGVLRKVWNFKPGSTPPTPEQIESLLPSIGWNKVNFSEHQIIVPNGMEIDFGGIGKEYAVDRVSQLANERFPNVSVVVNFGGDMRINCAPHLKSKWNIGVDAVIPGLQKSILIAVGAVCTSGDTHRYIEYQGKRYGHILNPKTGWPVVDAAKTITVIHDQCMQAGILSTLAMLKGKEAEDFLEEQGVQFFCQR